MNILISSAEMLEQFVRGQKLSDTLGINPNSPTGLRYKVLPVFFFLNQIPLHQL